MALNLATIAIVTTNKFDSDSKTVLKSSEDSDFPATNVQDKRVAVEWRSTSDASSTPEWVGFDLTAGPPNLTFLVGHNIPQTAVITLEGSSSVTFASIDASYGLTWHRRNIGFFLGLGTWRYWRVKVDTSSGGPGPDAYIRFGRLIMCYATSVTTIAQNNDINPDHVNEDLSDFTESEENVLYHKKKSRPLRFSNILWTLCNETTKNNIETIWHDAYTTEPVIVLLDGTNDINNLSLYGLIEKPGITWQRQFVDEWNIRPFIIKELM